MKKKIHILIADDDKYFRMPIKELLDSEAIITEAESETEAMALIEQHYFDIALIDMDIDGPKSGINILQKTKIKGIHSIILSSQNDDAIIEEAYNSGCDHFLAKLHYRTHLPPYIHKYKNKLFGNNTDQFFENSYITNDIDLRTKIDEICQISLKGKSILITGETGVGKSLIGKLFHEQTYDETKPFIHINCSEISETLMESELFGHKKGAFTGALQDKKGKLELAHGGTLFLDEVGTMPPSMQQKLLKALDQKSFYPVGSDKEIHCEFTLITATCDDLFDLIHQEKFRKDLFYRISGLNLHIKSLKERREDIPKLIQFFLNSSPRRIIIKSEAVEKMKLNSWPGNIRELKKYVEYLSMKNKGIISEEDIIFGNTGTILNDQSYLTTEQKEYISTYGLRDFMKKIEEESLKSTLDKHKGKITHVIKELKISSSAFYRIFENLKASF